MGCSTEPAGRRYPGRPRPIRAAAIVGLAGALATGCARPVATARTTPDAPPMPREARADSALENLRCSTRWGLVMPGLGRRCLGRNGEGAVLLTLTGAELAAAGAGLASTGQLEHPAVLLPLVGFQDLWVYEHAMTGIEEDLARRLLYAPQDDLADLAAAPFNPRVLTRPRVWLSILGTAAAGAILTALLDDGTAPEGSDVNYFGHQLPPAVGYPAAGLTYSALFTHVALAEEALFRGRLQSQLARAHGATAGWAWASLIFGVTHALNASALEGDERRDYLLYAVPFITAIGSVIGLNYRWADYSLTAPVAVHYWYNLLVSAVGLAMHPQESMLSASFRVPF